MSRTSLTCREVERELPAVVSGEAAPGRLELVEAHVAACPPCRDELAQYRAVEGLVADLRVAPISDPTLARAQLESRLADLRSRIVHFGVFSSPLGPILIARSEQGVSLVEYLPSEQTARASRIRRLVGMNAIEDPERTEAFFRDLLDYLAGRRTQLEWSLDLRLARGDFQRRVLRVTSSLPYGAVTSYARIAREIGSPTATRAVAQALRWNPLPIIIPCHRVIGSSGDLTGYAGDKLALKQRLLTVEGVPTVMTRKDFRVDRRAMYHWDASCEEYCLPTCGSIATRPLAEVTLFATRERAESAGLAPCTECRPDLHPLPA